MDPEASLFDDDLAGDAPTPAPPAPAPGLADWQVAALRRALDSSGIEGLAGRQAVIEQCVGHPVAALRELTSAEATSILERLAAAASSRGAGGSAWDDRDHDTWIDKL